MGKSVKSARARFGGGGGAKESAFDFIHAKPHHEILGRRIKGLAVNAAVSRARGVENRKRTLAVQLAREGHTSKFVDERFGEQAADMSAEDKMLGRYKLAKKAKVSSRASRYALDDNDGGGGGGRGAGGGGLTHMGEALGEHNMGTWDEPSDDEEQDAELSLGSARYVRELNFGGGGGAGGRPGADAAGADGEGEPVKSRAEVMEEIIAKSKFYRAERHRAKLEQVEATQQLDADFAGIRGLLAGYMGGAPPDASAHAAPAAGEPPAPAAPPGRAAAAVERHADYDALSRELAVASRARPSNRLRTEEERLEAEAERLTRLEAERKARMGADLASVGAAAADVGLAGGGRAGARARTDDDLEVNFRIDGDGGSGSEGEGEGEGEGEEGSGAESSEVGSGSDDDDEEDDEDEEGGYALEAGREPMLPSDRGLRARPAPGSGEDEEGEAEEEDGDMEEEAEEAMAGGAASTRAPASSAAGAAAAGAAAAASAAAAELPYTPACPQSEAELDALLALARGSAESEHLLLNRVLATNHVKLGAANKPRMAVLFGLLLGRVRALCAGGGPVPLRSVDALCAPMHTLCQMVQMGAAERAKAVVAALAAGAERRRAARRKEASGAPEAGGGPAGALARAREELAELLTLKLCANLFPTSDRRHPVCTAAVLLLASGARARAPLLAASDCLLAVGRCGLLLHYAAAEGGETRFAPELPPELARIGRALAAALAALPPADAPPARGAAQQRRRGAEAAAANGAPHARSLLDHIADGMRDASCAPLAAPPAGAEQPAASAGCLLDAARAWAALGAELATALADCASAPEVLEPAIESAAALAAALGRLGALGSGAARAAERAEGRLREASRVAVARRAPLALQRRAPVALRGLEPDFEESGRAAALDRPTVSVTPSMLPGASREEMRAAARQMREAQTLRGQHRRELKAARRELRKDAAFLAAERHKRNAERDTELEGVQKQARAILEHQEANFKTMLHDRKKALMGKP